MLLLITGIYIITFFFTIILSVFVLLSNHKNYINRYFSLLSFSIGLWILSNIIINLAYNQTVSLLFVKIAIIWVVLLPIFFNQFVKYLYFPGNIRYEKLNQIFLYIAYLITSIIILLSQTSLNIKSISFESWGVGYKPGILYIILLFYMLIVFGFSFSHLFIISRDYKNPKRYQAKFVLLGACVTVILSILTNIVFPFLGYGFVSMFGPTTILIFLTFIAYSITRHHLFNIRVITIELITFGLWTIILIRTLLANTLQERLIEGGLLVVTVVFGIMLIRSALKEIGQREHIEQLARDLEYAYAEVKDLNEHLEMKVTEQTKEITRAYEVEKKARGELEKLDETKNELITTAQHNLRTPLTALRWQLEEIRKSVGDASKSETSAENNGNDGDKASDAGNNELQKAVKESEASVMRLTEVLEDFLKIAKVRVGEK
ncbi:MAG: histidine kinase N-terminal 7TM domain-containing protein [Patescibacteria group bacterium]